jgi:hypothetical protein
MVSKEDTRFSEDEEFAIACNYSYLLEGIMKNQGALPEKGKKKSFFGRFLGFNNAKEPDKDIKRIS